MLPIDLAAVGDLEEAPILVGVLYVNRIDFYGLGGFWVNPVSRRGSVLGQLHIHFALQG